VSCLLAFATGLALLGLAELLVPSSPGSTAPNAEAVADAATVRRLYAAVDDALATGNLAPLESVLAPSFVDHAAAPGQPADRTGFEQRLVALRAVFPALRLTVTELVAEGDEAVARVQAQQATPAAFLGIPLPADWPVWGTIDVFRLADGQVVEHWSGDVPTASLDAFLPASLTLPPDAPTLVVTREAIAPGGTGAAPGTIGPTLLWVVAGAPTVTLDAVYAPRAEVTRGAGHPDAGTPTAIAPGATVELAAGDLVRIEDARFTMRNPGATSAVLLTVASDPRPPFHGAATQGVATAVLADGRGTALPPDPVVVAVGRVTLAAGAGLPGHRVVGTVLVEVEAGTAVLTIGGGTAAIRRETGTATVATSGQTTETISLGQGEAGLVAQGTTAEIRNVGESPVTLVVVAVFPDRSGAAAPAGTPGSGGA
jgi:predicted ester cyclase